ncbi:MAG: hypothetical protein K6G56_09425 [Clostridiales bacterium]|nr:hypothetical protein [Clostridiales bacterium]
MKKTRRLILALLALVLAAVFCGAVFAEEDNPTEAPAVTAGADATEDPATGYLIGFDVRDGEGNPVQSSGAMSCLGGNATLYIDHDYTLVAHFYDSARKLIEGVEPKVSSVDDPSGSVSYEGNKVYLKASHTPYSFKIGFASGQNIEGINVIRYNFSIIDIVIAFLGVYVVVNAIRGKGNLFSDEFIKEDKKASFKRIMIVLALIAGVALVAAAVLTICFSYIDSMRTVKLVLLAVAIASLLGMSIVNGVMTDKEKRMKAQQGGGVANGGHAPGSAFEFDENEPTLDEVLANLEKKKDSADNTDTPRE